MSISSEFIEGFFSYFNSLGTVPEIFIILITVVLLIVSPQLKKCLDWIGRKFTKKRNCGDCILIVFNITEKYISQEQIIKGRILTDQMNYVEQKIETIILELLQTYKEDQIELLKNVNSISEETLEKEYWGYKQSLTNSIDLAKREIRRSFKENGFHNISGKEFSYYVKDKTQDVLAISRRYLMNDYPKNTIVPLNYRFDNFDIAWFEDIFFDIYIKAKEIKIEAINKIKELEDTLKKEVNEFINQHKGL